MIFVTPPIKKPLVGGGGYDGRNTGRHHSVSRSATQSEVRGPPVFTLPGGS